MTGYNGAYDVVAKEIIRLLPGTEYMETLRWRYKLQGSPTTAFSWRKPIDLNLRLHREMSGLPNILHDRT